MNHTQASHIVKEEWQKVYGRPPSKLETLFTMCVAWIETNYSRAKGQHADMAARGLYNWANLEKPRNADESCDSGWEPGVDWEQYGGTKKVCFRVYKSDNEAANALIRNLTGRHWPVIRAIESDGSAESVAHAMKTGFDGRIGSNGAYYTASESGYANALKNAASAIGKELKENYELVREKASTGNIAVGIGILAVAGAIFAGTLHIKGKR